LRADEAGVTLTGTNMEQAITAPIGPSVVDAPGALTLRAKPILEALKVLPPDAEITIEASELHAVIRSGSLTMKLAHMPTEDFPARGEPAEWSADFQVPAGELLRLLATVAYCVSTEETRYYLNGIYLHVSDGDLASVATDGHRLMVARASLPAGAERWTGEIIPRDAVKNLRALLRAVPADASVRFRAGNLRVAIDAPSWGMATKTIDGTFPEYRRVIPARDEACPRLTIEAPAAVLTAIRQVQAVAEHRSSSIALAADGAVTTLSGRYHNDGGEAQVAIPEGAARWTDKRPSEAIGLQGRYLKAVAQAFPSGFEMQIANQHAPIRIDGKEGVAVLMPMRI
jgi:DNA polymerase-3 subunit beta